MLVTPEMVAQPKATANTCNGNIDHPDDISLPIDAEPLRSGHFPHKPDLRGKNFSAWTDHVEATVIDLPKSAIILWNRLLRDKPGGVDQLVELKELAEEFDYSFQSMKNAIAKLVNCGLVEILRNFGKGVMQLVAFNVGPVAPLDKNFCKTKKELAKSQTDLPIRKKTCKLEPETQTETGIDSLQINANLTTSTHTYQEEASVQEVFPDSEPLRTEEAILEMAQETETQENASPTAQQKGEDPASENPTVKGFDAFWDKYCGTKSGHKGHYRRAKGAYLALKGWSDASILAFYEADFVQRMKQAEASRDGFYESFPYLENYLQEGYLRAVQQRLECPAPTSPTPSQRAKTPVTPAYAWSEEDRAYYAALCRAGLVDNLPIESLPVVSGGIHVRKRIGNNRFVLVTLDELRSDVELYEIELALAFMRQAQKPNSEDRGLGLAGLRSLWASGLVWLQSWIKDWAYRNQIPVREVQSSW